jgi:hypothetical protein
MSTVICNTVIGQQGKDVQTLCGQFTQSYNNHRKTIAEWGRLLQAIRDSNLNPVNADGTPLTGEDVQVQTFSAICRELGCPRSTAYHYIDIYLVTKTYPEWLQTAATASNLNLAAQHVQDAFESMRESIPTSPDAFQVAGVVAKLKQARAPVDPQPRESAQARFQRLLKEALEFAKKEEITPEFVTATLESEIAASFGMAGARVTRELSPIYTASQTER